MRRSLVSAVVSVLVLSVLAVGCGITPDEPGAVPSEADPQSTVPGPLATDGSTADESTSDESTPGELAPDGSDGSDPDGSTEGSSGGFDELCDKLRIISEADLELTAGAGVDEMLDQWAKMWPEVAQAYDDAIAIAPAEMAEDLRLIKRVSEIMNEALSGAQDEADVTEAIVGLSEEHQEDVLAAGQAAIRAEEFTQDECGFSLNNE